MREGQFIKKNLQRWESYQHGTDDPDELAQQFTTLVDDLSYAKTFYPGSKTVKYINSIAASIYLSIYKNKKEKQQRIFTFWQRELPLIIRSQHRLLLFTLLFFIFFVLIGVFSAYYDQTFIRAILGDHYVDFTEQNIASGHPFRIYDNTREVEMFLQIAFNNTKVAFTCYTLGVTAGIGTLYFIFYNALIFGAFQSIFLQHGLGGPFILVVFIHGLLELWSIIIAGTAGLMLGNALLFPGTYTRIQSLMMAAKDSIKVIVSLVPNFIVAAFFEGFVTRHTEMPLAVSLFILLSVLCFIIWYYILYPKQLFRKLQRNDDL